MYWKSCAPSNGWSITGEKYNIRVLNLSFAQTPRWPYWEDPVAQAAMRAWAALDQVVAAAGNEGLSNRWITW